jgi:hypothetical protein
MASLFYDDEYQALRSVIEGGKGYKETAAHLWPGMKIDSAYAKLKACTQDRGDQRLKFREYIAAMVFNERYDILYFMCDETFHQRPQRKAPAEEEAKIVQAVEHATGTLDRALRALQDLKRRAA